MRRLVTRPTSEPVSLAEAKAHCRIYGTDDDGVLAGYIIAARQTVERATRQALVTQTWDEIFDRGWPLVWDAVACCYRTRLELSLAPVQSITSVSYVDPAGTTQTLTAGTQYQATRLNTPAQPAVLHPAFGFAWPATRDVPESVTVRYVAGYTDAIGGVPEPIRFAILLLVGHYFENREAGSERSLTELPFGVRSLLADYVVGGSPEAVG